ncbi:hypothetical protein GmHk_05G013706 [Glycine max]|nr:hypothetical protein GmHk_05G013706 [Glycine max]
MIEKSLHVFAIITIIRCHPPLPPPTSFVTSPSPLPPSLFLSSSPSSMLHIYSRRLDLADGAIADKGHYAYLDSVTHNPPLTDLCF